MEVRMEVVVVLTNPFSASGIYSPWGILNYL